MQVIIDTSAIIGLIDRSSPKHEDLKKAISHGEITMTIPSAVIPESCYMINKYFGVKIEIIFLEEIINASFQLEIIRFSDLARIAEILKKYQKLNIGFVDASIVAIAERLKINKLLTLDKKHFEVLVPLGFDYFDIMV